MDTARRESSAPVAGSDDSRGALGLSLISAPTHPRIDLIFAHGLGGSARKTWISKAEGAFWPEWFSDDPLFSGVRVFSYGYSSNWSKDKDNCLSIHHLGKGLLGSISTTPEIKNSSTPIILLGHSMGGLVIKKAYVLACQDSELRPLARRCRAIYFLATPHRGSDLAKVLRNILRVVSISRDYVNDIMKSSMTLQSLNDEFRQSSSELELWSFYETQKMRSNGVSVLVVDPESATLGFQGEKQIPLNADHNNICKFSSPADSNYILVRNALVTTVEKLGLQTSSGECRVTTDEIRQYLCLPESLNDDFFTAKDERMDGTCEWVTSQEWYTRWKGLSHPIEAPLLWIAAKPATGKSVLAGFLVDDIRSTQEFCSFYFFKRNDNVKSKLSFCLRCLAFQMACQDEAVRCAIGTLVENSTFLDLDNERSVWRTLFDSCIFQCSMETHHWVIDGLDECVNPRPLFEMLSKTERSRILRIVVTAIESSGLQQSFSILAPRFQRVHLRIEDTQPDIERLVLSKTATYTFIKSEDVPALAKKITEKANGSFLWCRLVLEELSQCYSENDVNQVLDEIPEGMKSLYNRSLNTMVQATRAKRLAEAILTWVSCAVRPLTVEELESVLELDLKDKFHNLGEKLGSICAHLVVLDRSERVGFVHDTARRFLLDPHLESEFAIRENDGHARISKVCLEYLSSEDIRPPRTGRRKHNRRAAPSTTCSASHYIFEEFSSHLALSRSSAVSTLPLLETFLRSNILSWIERTANGNSLSPMVQVARNLRTFSEYCASDLSPLRKDIQTVRRWSVDLQRIAAKFSAALLVFPGAIYSLVAPFCPEESAIHSIRIPGRKLQILGITDPQWDDRLTCIDFQEGTSTALAYGEDFFAVGFIKGNIILYHSNSCQKYRTLKATETVQLLCFKSKSNLMASAGLKSIQIWDVRSGQQLYQLRPRGKTLALDFAGSHLLASSASNVLQSWELGDEATALPDVTWTVQRDGATYTLPKRRPSALSMSLPHNILATAYNGSPITLWDFDDNTFYGTCGKKLSDGTTSTHPVTSLLFNPNSNVPLLAVSYLDGELVIIDPFDDEEIAKQRVDSHTLAASPDGRLLAGGAAGGIIQIFEFDTLRLLYKVKSASLYIQRLVFSFDGAQLADLRGSQCNVWRPSVLVSQNIDDDVSIDTCSTLVENSDSSPRIPITVIVPICDGYIICGKSNGSVDLYDAETGSELLSLYTHHSAIQHLRWISRERCILSICVSNSIKIFSWGSSPLKNRHTSVCRLQSRLEANHTITRVVATDIESNKFILSTEISDHFWDEKYGEQLSRQYDEEGKSRVWIQHPKSKPHVLLIHGNSLKVVSWLDWSEVHTIDCSFDISGAHIRQDFCTVTGDMLLELRENDGTEIWRGIYWLLTTASPEDSPSPFKFEIQRKTFGRLLNRIRFIIGIVDTSIVVFLDIDSWVCSIDLIGKEDIESYSRHFFVPYDWFAGIPIPASAIRNTDIVFAKDDGIAIIEGAFEQANVTHIA